jgi:hypothetical protein
VTSFLCFYLLYLGAPRPLAFKKGGTDTYRDDPKPSRLLLLNSLLPAMDAVFALGRKKKTKKIFLLDLSTAETFLFTIKIYNNKSDTSPSNKCIINQIKLIT